MMYTKTVFDWLIVLFLTFQTFSFTIFSLGYQEMSMGIVSGLITFPIILTILVLFRRSQVQYPSNCGE